MNIRQKQVWGVVLTFAASAVISSCTKPAGGEPASDSKSNSVPGGTARGGRGGRGGPSDRPTPVEIALVKRGSVSRNSVIAGMLEPIRTVGVNAQLSGTLLSLKAEEGYRVRQGDVLAEIDARELEAQSRSAEANLNFARSTVERSEQLFKQQIITLAELERDRASFESAKATSEQLTTRLGYARVLAPITGIITEKRVEAGDIVSSNTRLFTVADVSTLVTRIQVSELEVSTLRPGDMVPLTVDALGAQHVTGRIRRVFPAADSATRLVPVEVALSGAQLANLRPGYTVRATLALDRRDDALLVPSRAVSGPAGARAVYVVTGGVIERRSVRIGSDMAGLSEILEGVAEGDSVIVSGTSMIREGAKAKVVEPLGDQVPPGRTLDTTTTRPPGGARRGGRGEKGGST
ncbi:MAG TPA: efflux RND transporter periplasmic adaptor subunit [Gemmatimonadaceae bacterium]